MNTPNVTEQTEPQMAVRSSEMVSLLARAMAHCHELRNNYCAKYGDGDHTRDILDTIIECKKMIRVLEQANDRTERRGTATLENQKPYGPT